MLFVIKWLIQKRRKKDSLNVWKSCFVNFINLISCCSGTVSIYNVWSIYNYPPSTAIQALKIPLASNKTGIKCQTNTLSYWSAVRPLDLNSLNNYSTNSSKIWQKKRSHLIDLAEQQNTSLSCRLCSESRFKKTNPRCWAPDHPPRPSLRGEVSNRFKMTLHRS